MKFTKDNIIRGLSFIVMLVGLTLVGLPILSRQKLEELKPHTRAYVKNVSAETLSSNHKKDVDYDFSRITTVQPQDVIKAAESLKNLDNVPVVGAVAVPELGVNLPIIKGIDDLALMTGAGTMKDGQEMGQGNYAIASHTVFNYNGSVSDLLFSPMHKAKKGMKVYITDKTTVYEYTVTDVYEVEPTQVEVIDDVKDRKMITFVTCTDFAASRRVIVQGDLTKTYKASETPKEVADSFNLDVKNDYSTLTQ